ncbi:MAG: hypothetical protein ABIX01_08075 [Chitinophagaceae bacterium]
MFKDAVFTQAFEKAELAKFDQTELDSYENSLKNYRDLKGIIDTAFEEGKIEGKMEGKIDVAKSAKRMGLSTADIVTLTGLSESEINRLKFQGANDKYPPFENSRQLS